MDTPSEADLNPAFAVIHFILLGGSLLSIYDFSMPRNFSVVSEHKCEENGSPKKNC